MDAYNKTDTITLSQSVGRQCGQILSKVTIFLLNLTWTELYCYKTNQKVENCFSNMINKSILTIIFYLICPRLTTFDPLRKNVIFLKARKMKMFMVLQDAY